MVALDVDGCDLGERRAGAARPLVRAWQDSDEVRARICSTGAGRAPKLSKRAETPGPASGTIRIIAFAAAPGAFGAASPRSLTLTLTAETASIKHKTWKHHAAEALAGTGVHASRPSMPT